MIFKSFSQKLKSSIWLQGLLVAAIAYPVGVMAQSKTEHVISQKNRTYAPGKIEINKGESVTFLNDDVFLHNAILEDERMSFDSGSMEEGESLTVKFKKTGTFNVKCAIHPKMNLEVTVVK